MPASTVTRVGGFVQRKSYATAAGGAGATDWSPQCGISAWPRAGSCQWETYAMQQRTCLFDDLVGEGMHLEGNLKAKRLCGLQVEHEIELSWLQNRQVGRLLAFENAAHIASGLVE